MSQNKSNEQKRAIWAIQRRYGIDKDNADNQATTQPNNRVSNKRAKKNSYNQRLRQDRRPPRKVTPTRKKGSLFKRILLLIALIIIVSIGVFGYKIIATGDKITVSDRSILGQLRDLLLSQNNVLAGENEGRINIMLIAVGGEGHKGKDLADTIMIASINPHTNKAALLSIPRDLYVQVPEREYFSKINAVHAYGESQKTDNGPIVLGTLLEEITGQPIHYYIRIDFTAFKNIIDAIGGINITIENSFFDYWHKISFPAGTEKMNGERALAYVRARYIEGPEGGDFKRAARQQQMLLASREKVFSVQTALDFTKLNSILNSLSDNIRTDMQLWEMKRFFELARITEPSQVHSEVLSPGPKGVLIGGTEILGGVPASILRPRTGNYSEIQTIAANLLKQTDTDESQAQDVPAPKVPTPTPTPTPKKSKIVSLPTVEIRNGTKINGLAKQKSDELSDKGYEIVTIGNAISNNTTETIIYYISDEQEQSALNLAQTLSVKTAKKPPESETGTSADILLILGQDQQ